MPLSPERKRALILGVSGQDGAYLAQFLLAKNYEVWGTSRHIESDHPNLRTLGILDCLKLVACNMLDSAGIRAIVDAASPDEIYNLAGQTSVSYSFEHPLNTFHSIADAALNLLDCLRLRAAEGKQPIRLFHAGSAECFGDHGRIPVNETTPFHPTSPYGVAKASAHMQVACFREAFGLYACSGILFNHESPLRPQKFVTQKIVAAVGAIARGSTAKLHLGAIDICRDWGWAPEYVEAMWLMLQQPAPRDFILATGHTVSLRDFVETAFASIGRASSDFLVEDPSLLRPTEIQYSCADPSAIRDALGWSAKSRMPDVVRLMLEADARAYAAAHVK